VTATSGFSIGDAAAMVGVSTHVLRSWERRLSLDLNHRTRSNQRRYWMEDINRFIAIRQLHEKAGLPLVESAARALNATQPTRDAPDIGFATVDSFWAALIDMFPDVLVVIDGRGRIAAANEVARTLLRIRPGMTFMRLAPDGWRQTYDSLLRAPGRSYPMLLGMRAGTDVAYVNARVEPIGTRPGGPKMLIAKPIPRDEPSEGTRSSRG
jgi:DNA-binding transcriptional MerR regulator